MILGQALGASDSSAAILLVFFIGHVAVQVAG